MLGNLWYTWEVLTFLVRSPVLLFFFEINKRILVGVEWIMTLDAKNSSKALCLLVLDHFLVWLTPTRWA